ncbi:hypothetical protein KCP70_00560 [Salmonella enterica subsp. enterica]|nr:hypothetical protein KCP70_00560 [Salmonella enterica subsp. enterica]
MKFAVAGQRAAVLVERSAWFYGIIYAQRYDPNFPAKRHLLSGLRQTAAHDKNLPLISA